MVNKALLVLEDGTIFEGKSFGYPGDVIGEVVFNTGMVGYPETLTDPSYKGQILVSTYPLIGNYGVPKYKKDHFGLPIGFESDKIQVSGYLVSDICKQPSHWSSNKSLNKWLIDNKIPGIFGIDTRKLTKKIRKQGAMMGAIKILKDSEKIDIKEVLSQIRKSDYTKISHLSKVSNPRIKLYKSGGSPKVVLIDCGTKNNIIRSLLKRNIDVITVPYNCTYDEIMEYQPSGIVISNGPGDARLFQTTIETIKHLMNTDIPILGICLGIQLITLAAGGNISKMKYGHRGQNHPCIDTISGRCYITSQNHGYQVDSDSLNDFNVTFVNGNDGGIEGIQHKSKDIVAVQFHPEATPGPTDTGYLFDEFAERVQKYV